ncbi:hypothetical protein L3Y34_012385 [Caenorhabditis briggsae]|uniref:Cullin family profile domain-containing protein n=1 Tax=Caenorhabditis briggsae TaxID=6238 RepID=A0AAE9CVR0_CAEBR|nr:hypothetical protein L3Y34_012385 [Caenorhabditis briggsae]
MSDGKTTCDATTTFAADDVLFIKQIKKLLDENLQILPMITTFKYMEDKNIFVKFYTKHFCKRLLDKQSTSDKTESSFISRLAECCGYEYTSRLAKMVQDTQVSKDLSSGYKDQQLESSRRKKNIELGIQVLSTGTWRSMMLVNFDDKKFLGRKLSWVYNQSRREITSTAFKGKKYVFGATTTQSRREWTQRPHKWYSD